MNKFKKLPKLHLVASTDELRPALEHILITSEHVVVTDTNVLVWHDTKALLDIDVPEGKEFLIHRSVWAEFQKKHMFFEFDFKNLRLRVQRTSGLTFTFDFIENNTGLNFPNYKGVLPTEETVPVNEIGFNVNLAKNVEHGLFYPGELTKSKWTFYGPTKGVLIESVHSESYAKALLMPCLL